MCKSFCRPVSYPPPPLLPDEEHLRGAKASPPWTECTASSPPTETMRVVRHIIVDFQSERAWVNVSFGVSTILRSWMSFSLMKRCRRDHVRYAVDCLEERCGILRRISACLTVMAHDSYSCVVRYGRLWPSSDGLAKVPMYCSYPRRRCSTASKPSGVGSRSCFLR